MKQDYIPFVMFGSFLAFIVVIITLANRYAKKRTQGFVDAAQTVGFEYLGKNWTGPTISPQPKITLLHRTRGRYSNVMRGSTGGLQVSLFDYTYPQGKGSVTVTIASYSRDLPLPPFELHPEGVFDRLGDAIVHNDIDFESHPEFSRRFLLRSPDEANTRKLFNASLLTYFEQISEDKKWHIETSSTPLIFYRGWPAKAADVPAFLEETSALARAIFDSASNLKGSIT